MGRAVVKVSDALVAVILAQGSTSSVPVAPIKEARVVDARFRNGNIELLIESPRLESKDGLSLDEAPDLAPAFARAPRLEGAPLLNVIGALDLLVRQLEKPWSGAPSWTVTAAGARRALNDVPTVLLEDARAARPVVNAAASGDAGDDERHGEVPGA